ncbi:MAG TPA: aconitate hydratase [Candidatus Mucispirillum faecigallinarum]|uniref:Aconitate hydratase A n=1 Tax=Candidatus Mucispirillum faecigallinarum TaxID=2838699 RepID=A0A9D2KAR6_9BACT|nr:aconitate hydratase [Candidatus Mucispirillum faecigallinarum]
MFETFYKSFSHKVDMAKNKLGRPLTLTEKILYAHLFNESDLKDYKRGEDYVNFKPDRVAMQDATAQMALLQFMNAGKKKAAAKSSVHCDHLIQAYKGADIDLPEAEKTNKEVYEFLQSVAAKYGIDFWKPGAGIIHQVVLENYAFPGGMMIGTDSHTPNAGGLTMAAIGVGGADAADVMSGMEWELKMPKIIGVKLTGKLKGFAFPKDIILKLAGILTVKGGTNSIIEYFGEGTLSLPATGKSTVCNMGAEVGATTSIFPFDNHTYDYLNATGRNEIADLAEKYKEYLKADNEVMQNPEKYYDKVIEIDLDSLTPYINGPFTPDAAAKVSEMAKKVSDNNYPEKVEVALIGSCTNSSYQDLGRAANLLEQAVEKNIPLQAELIINPGSILVLETAKRDKIIDTFKKAGAVIMTNACGPCIGQWKRITDDNERKNTIVTTFNRNFAKRADGNPNTYAFIVSPEMAVAYAISGRLSFNPEKDSIKDKDGNDVMLSAPMWDALPKAGFVKCDKGLITPPENGDNITVKIDPESSRLQILKPFPKWDGNDIIDANLLIKTKGKCTTDHISMAGPWLKFRGHLENISDNMLMGAVNAFNDETNKVKNAYTNEYGTVSSVAKYYRDNKNGSIVAAEENYGEGSSREHAAMEPRFLGVKAIIAKSFARIHETNLKKQGMLALTFQNKDDYNLIKEGDLISIHGLKDFAPNKELTVTLKHTDGSTDTFKVNHTYNAQQIEWFKAGSALNNLKN